MIDFGGEREGKLSALIAMMDGIRPIDIEFRRHVLREIEAEHKRQFFIWLSRDLEETRERLSHYD